MSTGLFAAGSASLVLLISGITIAICSCVAYRKRKVLAREIRRVSVVAQRMSTKIRQSISGRGEEQEVDINEIVMQPMGKKQSSFFKDMQQFQDSAQAINRSSQYKMTTNDSARGTEEIIVTDRKKVKFDPAQNEEISVKSASSYSKKSEF